MLADDRLILRHPGRQAWGPVADCNGVGRGQMARQSDGRRASPPPGSPTGSRVPSTIFPHVFLQQGLSGRLQYLQKAIRGSLWAFCGWVATLA
jgi:hypothetical protein